MGAHQQLNQVEPSFCKMPSLTNSFISSSTADLCANGTQRGFKSNDAEFF